ncbi:MAG: sulfotransferase [Pseudomonadota bacterium]
MSDREKERVVRNSGAALLNSAFGMGWRMIAALWSAILPVAVADHLGWADMQHVLGFMRSLEFIISTSVAASVLYMVWRQLRGRGSSTGARPTPNDASADQLVHTLAFSSPWVMKSLAALDDIAAYRTLKSEPDLRPIFITSLARGGTTALLNALHSIPGLAAHRYRDMPLITAPYLWSKLSGRRKVLRQARAHGDGLEIDLDSPEAFDEVLWKLYWPEKYDASRIYMWKMVDKDRHKVKRLTQNFRKIAALRSDKTAPPARYNFVSKNNANIARLGLLGTAFPGARVVIPIRRPAPHAQSLHRQHLNYLARHSEDPFSKRYMCDLGHFEFGELHRPIHFPGQSTNRYKPDDKNYWLHYWIAAFREVARHRDKCLFVTQDALRADPDLALHALAQDLKLDVTGLSFEAYFKTGEDAGETDGFDQDLLKAARNLYSVLASRAFAPPRLLTGAEISKAAQNIL